MISNEERLTDILTDDMWDCFLTMPLLLSALLFSDATRMSSSLDGLKRPGCLFFYYYSFLSWPSMI